MNFFDFLNYSVTPYHTVDFLKQGFAAAGFVQLDEASLESVVPGGAYFVERGGALAAFRMPKEVSKTSKVKLALAHTDFPALKVTPQGEGGAAGLRTLHSEIYGSPLFTSWLDRDLGYAGLLAFEKNGSVGTKLFRGKKLLRIPQLAIHLNRGVNQDGLKVDPQVDLNALWTAADGASFADVLQKELGDGETLLDFDVQLFDAQGANVGGMEDEWIYSGRLDNLSSCHAIFEALTSNSSLEKDFSVGVFFNNEEVGSTTREGAASNFLGGVLAQICAGTGVSVDAILSQSLALSIDMAHGTHPNHPEKHDPGHRPAMGGGVVLKTNAQKRYASDVFSSAQFKLLCKQSKVPYQVFVSRNDMPCGSTVGPTVSAKLGIPTVDIGEPMLSMHSIREMISAKDHGYMIQLVSALYKDC